MIFFMVLYGSLQACKNIVLLIVIIVNSKILTLNIESLPGVNNCIINKPKKVNIF